MIFLFLYAVPYWGSLYFNDIIDKLADYEDLEEFPSPIGVLYISIEKTNGHTYNYLFPSPIGVLYISIIISNFFGGTLSVSVPYWGSLYFN